MSYGEGVFNCSKFTWYLESCSINLWGMKDKLVSSWYLSSDVHQLHWQRLLPHRQWLTSISCGRSIAQVIWFKSSWGLLLPVSFARCENHGKGNDITGMRSGKRWRQHLTLFVWCKKRGTNGTHILLITLSVLFWIQMSLIIMRVEISGDITPERMKGWSQSKNNTQLWMWLVIEARSDAVKRNIA